MGLGGKRPVFQPELCLPHYVILISNHLPFVLLFLQAKDLRSFVWWCTMPCPVIHPIHHTFKYLVNEVMFKQKLPYILSQGKRVAILHCTYCFAKGTTCTEEMNHLLTSEILNDSVLALVVFRAVAKSQSGFAAVKNLLCISLLVLMNLWNRQW